MTCDTKKRIAPDNVEQANKPLRRTVAFGARR